MLFCAKFREDIVEGTNCIKIYKLKNNKLPAQYDQRQELKAETSQKYGRNGKLNDCINVR